MKRSKVNGGKNRNIYLLQKLGSVDICLLWCNNRMSTIKITDTQRSKIYSFLRACSSLYAGKEADSRQFIEVIL